MYETYYGLNSRPFQLTPDPHYYFESLTHRKALSYLGYGLAQGEGFIVITGDVGAGKTTLVSHLMATIDKSRLTAANIVTTKLDSQDIVRVAANHFDIDTDNMDKAQLLSAIEEFLHSEARNGRRCLLIVDESQNLPTGALEELRMLSNFQLGGQALLQIFLLGQPEFRDMLQNSNQLEQLRQRVIAHHHLEPMGADEIEPYITHRLSKSGWSGRPKITSDVFRVLYSETQGVPRKINTLMSRVLLMGAVEQVELIDQPLLGRVLADLNGDKVEISTPAAPVAPDVAAKSPLWEKPAKAKTAPAPTEEAEKSVPVSKSANNAEPNDVLALRSIVSEAENPKVSPQPESLKAESASVSSPDKGVVARVDIVSKRLSLLESRMNGQEENLHRVLTMLVDWVESDIRSKESYVNAGRAA
ncbi:XrtA/PEP-CTERM system-associated ATPase [Parasphingorhabdus halotolerans]|uniref:AAA family ATPase n=1 Tax=Parasphingorhabdus halotolerans TaxID=2725558 RepID=A0A6H2DKC9_9SPHN|nr:XrtA/PEP-CTERM system-associated ATPase [Parasphingorhabdus halotolerans]QJB68443.1 AAA family ATPase [Parasphingorhabdus halotolerans]